MPPPHAGRRTLVASDVVCMRYLFHVGRQTVRLTIGCLALPNVVDSDLAAVGSTLVAVRLAVLAAHGRVLQRADAVCMVMGSGRK